MYHLDVKLFVHFFVRWVFVHLVSMFMIHVRNRVKHNSKITTIKARCRRSLVRARNKLYLFNEVKWRLNGGYLAVVWRMRFVVFGKGIKEHVCIIKNKIHKNNLKYTFMFCLIVWFFFSPEVGLLLGYSSLFEVT